MYETAKKYFLAFLDSNFDLNDAKVSHKLQHTFYVVDNAQYICQSLGLNTEDTQLAMLIALLHDIGRFDQAQQMHSFREDILNYDHATLGVKFLFETGAIRHFIETNQYDNIIKKAIGNHSKYILEESNLTDKELLHCKIIRDADKLDSFRTKSTEDIFTMANITSEEIETSNITDKVFDDFMSEKTIFSKDRKTGIDIWISYIAFVFGLEFSCSLKLVKDKDYVNILFNRFDYKLDRDRMDILKTKALEYVERKSKNEANSI